MSLKYILIFIILALYLWWPPFQFQSISVFAQSNFPNKVILAEPKVKAPETPQEAFGVVAKILKNIPNTFINSLKESFEVGKSLWGWFNRNILPWFKDNLKSIVDKWLQKRIALIKKEIAKEKEEFKQQIKEGITIGFQVFWEKFKQNIKERL